MAMLGEIAYKQVHISLPFEVWKRAKQNNINVSAAAVFGINSFVGGVENTTEEAYKKLEKKLQQVYGIAEKHLGKLRLEAEIKTLPQPATTSNPQLFLADDNLED